MEDHHMSGVFPVRGKQRIAVYNALKNPASGRQVLEKARAVAPSMTYQDLRHILRDFEKKGIAVCLNPECQTGRLYVQTSTLHEMLISSVQVDLCAKIGRAKTRLAVLEEVANKRTRGQHPLTATEIRKQLNERYPLSLNHVIAALKFLREHRLVEIIDLTNRRNLKIYQITPLGKTILNHIG